MNHIELMNQRIANGEFGNPVDSSRLNAAWADLLAKAEDKTPNYNKISGLWAEGGDGKVAFSGYTKEDIVIPAGKKLLCFRKNSDNEKAPDMDLVFVTYNE
jgi:hypothetical protein